jgi:hypothetical protein
MSISDIIFSVRLAAKSAKEKGMGHSAPEVADLVCGWFDRVGMNPHDLSERNWDRVCRAAEKALREERC